ncbi:MAG TPA: response regulator transcription factor [Hanamia sp.]
MTDKRIIIADDHPLFLEGLHSVLEKIKGVDLLATVTNGRQLIDCLQQYNPDIVLLDLNMPRLDGIETLKILKSQFPKIRVIVLTSYYQPELKREIKLLGADGYLSKNSSANLIEEAIKTVAAGNTWFTDDSPVEASPSPFFIDDFMKKYQLTKREVEIIRMIVAGIPTREIGERLFVSEFTINAHRRNICRKLNVHTPVGLINFAKEQGLV